MVPTVVMGPSVVGVVGASVVGVVGASVVGVVGASVVGVVGGGLVATIGCRNEGLTNATMLNWYTYWKGECIW